jgi:acyl-homoserine-lactone acylase
MLQDRSRTRAGAWRAGLALALGAALAGAAPSAEAATAPVSVTFTAHGVPHVVAKDFYGLGYGYAYAVAKIDLCPLAQVFVDAGGRRAETFGSADKAVNPILGRPTDNLVADLASHLLVDDAAMNEQRAGLAPHTKALVEGYAAGFNRYLADIPPARRPKACRDAARVAPITADDVIRRAASSAMLVGLFDQELSDAQPPSAAGNRKMAAATPMAPLQPSDAGSNGYAFGGAATGNGRGLLLGNPHWYWQPTNRLLEAHLTVPGQYDVMGGSVVGSPLITLGFNRSLAWTQTVATDARGTIYELTLDPFDPTRYLVDGVSRPMQVRTVAVRTRTASGAYETVRHDFWTTEYGPVLASAQMPWTRTHAYALDDVGAHNNRYLNQLLEMGEAKNVHDLKARLSRTMGLFWLNTIAADSRGEALYADMTAVPDVPADVYRDCARPLAIPQSTLVKVLDGSRSACGWRTEAGSPAPGVMPASRKPSRFTRSYVGNSNSSYWVIDAGAPLDGFSPIIGDEQAPTNIRTRHGLLMAARFAGGRTPGASPQADMARLESLLFDNRDHLAELVLDDLLAACDRQPRIRQADGAERDLSASCAVLRRWDRKDELTSRGAQLFREFARLARPAGQEDPATVAGFWRVPFDPKDPIHTPRGLNTATDAPLQLLAKAADRLQAAGVAADAPLAEVQYIERNGQRFPLPGGVIFNRITLTLQAGGYREPIGSADSYIQVVGFDARGPVADTLVVNSQSTDPDSPWYADQAPLFAAKQWVRAPFRVDDVARAAVEPPLRLWPKRPSGGKGR